MSVTEAIENALALIGADRPGLAAEELRKALAMLQDRADLPPRPTQEQARDALAGMVVPGYSRAAFKAERTLHNHNCEESNHA